VTKVGAAPGGDADKRELSIRHPHGRIVHCSIVGAADLQKVVFYSHGFPASRIEATVAHRQALARGITLVALDRPGFGRSEWYPGRRFEDWAEDVAAVADYLGVQQFDILGVSGGTPTALAAAALLSERVRSLTIVSGVGPLDSTGATSGMNPVNRMLLLLGRGFPWIGRWVVWSVAHLWRSFPRFVMLWFGALLPSVDRQVVSRRDVSVILIKNIREALSQGVRGTVSEFMLLASDWSGLLAQVRVPTTIWHGDADTYVPLVMGELLHRGIEGSTFHKVVGGGHFMILDNIGNILDRYTLPR
jgi:pimeloyl-ACP methyl ester carboxylesterase